MFVGCLAFTGGLFYYPAPKEFGILYNVRPDSLESSMLASNIVCYFQDNARTLDHLNSSHSSDTLSIVVAR